MYWRAALIVGQLALALTFSFVWDGGLAVLALFAAWWLAWFVFARFDEWAHRTRRDLLRRHPST